jgi:hypothetical protein
VSAQAGIKAGQDGFQVKVQGDTDLQGAVIASTQAALQAGKNNFESAGILTTSDIQNKASYQASGVGISLSSGASPAGTSAGLGQDGQSSNSLSRSGISGIAADSSGRSDIDSSAALVNRFEQEKVLNEVNAQVTITQEFGQQASRAWGEFANERFLQAVKQGDEQDTGHPMVLAAGCKPAWQPIHTQSATRRSRFCRNSLILLIGRKSTNAFTKCVPGAQGFPESVARRLKSAAAAAPAVGAKPLHRIRRCHTRRGEAAFAGLCQPGWLNRMAGWLFLPNFGLT